MFVFFEAGVGNHDLIPVYRMVLGVPEDVEMILDIKSGNSNKFERRERVDLNSESSKFLRDEQCYC